MIVKGEVLVGGAGGQRPSDAIAGVAATPLAYTGEQRVGRRRIALSFSNDSQSEKEVVPTGPKSVAKLRNRKLASLQCTR